MGTLYSDIYSRFYKYIKDYRFAHLDKVELEEIFESFLNSGQVWFKFCKKDLYDKDDNTKSFNEVLTPEEQEILAKLMVIEWLTPEMYNIEELKMTLSHKDFRQYSQANHIEKKQDLYKQAKREVENMKIMYSYQLDDIESLK